MTTTYTPTAEAIAFFLEHGAFSQWPHETEEQGRQRSAREAAEAEALYLHAHQVADVVCEWERDGDSMMMAYRDGTLQPGAVLHCAMLMHVDATGCAHYLTGLHGIDDDSDDYRRVVRAQLADEAADELRAIIAAAQGA